ncbi:hypothetical protein GCM10009804_51420 [Kribbella hippodromi]|uniref:RelA/SpoT domain-containing protein n=1 Tax=Kribbella hippodromi TaxID=434347 RepID=A0ABN2DY71_9ACTN
MPSEPEFAYEPSDLYRAFAASRSLDWGPRPLSAADLACRHGEIAAEKSLELLGRTIAVEPRVTAEFLASVPSGCSPYQLSLRVKSPESLARKFRDAAESNRQAPIDDLLRYTVLTERPDDLVAAARETAGALVGKGWSVVYAMHSYTDGSRYKGIHAYLRTPEVERVEVQWHSVVSAQVKELTTRWYEIERSADSPDSARTAARENCVAASAQLRTPAGLETLAELGGTRVAVKNYSDSRQAAVPREARITAEQRTQPSAVHERDLGVAR